MAKKVNSKNQQGGITAETVNVGSQINQHSAEKKGVPTWLTVTGVLFGIIASVVAKKLLAIYKTTLASKNM